MLFAIVAFILGLYMCLKYKSVDFKEGLENNGKLDKEMSRCSHSKRIKISSTKYQFR